jgi:hypothetical protein
MLVSFSAKQKLDVCLNCTSTPCIVCMSLLYFYCRVSLAEYLCTQGLLTHVAGEPQQQLGVCPCCTAVLEEEKDLE